MRELVSVVVPAFNRGFTIRNALESIQNQSYPEWEAVVVDDGSTDDTREIVKAYSRQDARIRLLEHSGCRGAQAARNTALRAARGKWLAFLDSDDQWLPNSLEARLRVAGKSRVVHSECYALDSRGERRLFGVPPLRGQVYRDLLRRPGPVFPALLMSREALLQLGYLDERIVSYQEWDTTMRLARYCSFEFVTEPTFIYDCRHDGTISKNPLREAIGYEQIVDKHRWSILRYLGPRVLADHYQQAAFFYHKAKEEKRAKHCSVRAAIYWPFQPRLIRAAKRYLLKRVSKRLNHAHRNCS